MVREIAGAENLIIELITKEDEEEGSTIICIIKFVDQKSEEEIAEVFVEGIQSKEELRHAVGNITINGWSGLQITTTTTPSISQSSSSLSWLLL